jgi:hypothetical protein
MAEGPRMTAAELADKLLQDEHADVLLESVAWMAQQLMEAEVSSKVGAELGSAAWSGPRIATATGPGSGIPGWAASSWPSPSCALAATSPASWNRAGAPSRPWSPSCRRPTSTACRLARWTGWSGQMGLHHLSKDQVSRLCRGLDEQVRVFRERPWRASIPTCGWARRWSGPGAGWGAPQGAGDRRRRA